MICEEYFDKVQYVVVWKNVILNHWNLHNNSFRSLNIRVNIIMDIEMISICNWMNILNESDTLLHVNASMKYRIQTFTQ